MHEKSEIEIDQLQGMKETMCRELNHAQLASISAAKAEIERLRLEVAEQEAKVEQKKREHRE